MRSRLFVITFVALLFSLYRPALAQDRLLTIDDIYDPAKRVNFGGSPPTGLTWLNDGKHYLLVKKDPETRLSQLARVNAVTGDASPFYEAAKMEKAFAALAGLTQEDARQLANQGEYQMNPAKTSVLINHANDLFYYEFGSEKAARLTNSPEEEVGEEFSPDGRMVGYVRNGNLYIVDIAGQRERALTSDGGPDILNGRLDWVYQEELYGRGNFKGYWWSPDSSRIVYLQLNEAPVKDFTVVDHIPRLQETEITSYPKAGDPNPSARLGVVAVVGGETRWVDTYKYEGGDFLIVRVGWTPDGKKVVYQIQDREQTWLDLNYASPIDGKTENVLRETSKAWVEVGDEPLWLKDGSFLWLSDRSGWKHVYHYAPGGKLLRQVTDGKWEVRSLHGVDQSSGLVYFSGTEHSHIAVHVYKIRLDGSGLTRLSQAEGNHAASFNPTFTHYLDTWSDVNTPSQVRLMKADGAPARAIDENRVEALKQFKLGKVEFVQVKTRDGFVMEAMMIKPPDFNPDKKYPVMSHTYGGPQAPQVRNAWGSSRNAWQRYMWHQMLAQKGYIIWICDNRSASGKGVESAWPSYRNFGELELRDLEDGVSWLKSQPYVDGSRIGIWGWSFGGYMTSYAMTHSKSFKVGIAGGTVSDWRLYDSIYTERYMGTPQNNPEGYEKTSPLRAAANLSGKILLLHGTMDDNVHVQNTIKLVYELQKAGKQFDLMLYPKSRHGVVDPLLLKHMMSLMTDFITRNL